MMVVEDDLKVWNVEKEAAIRAALSNMANILDGTPLKVDDHDGHPVVMLEDDTAFKASLILAPNLREKVEHLLGWPVLAVTPCRDFVYLFKVGDEWLLERIGEVVVEEFEGSGYPLTLEVLQISDSGIRPVFKFGE